MAVLERSDMLRCVGTALEEFSDNRQSTQIWGFFNVFKALIASFC